jgi:predicted NUDIX family NTP pyrophosphohydrolase
VGSGVVGGRSDVSSRRSRRSAGILLWRKHDGELEVLLGHPGGPLFAKKDADTWTVLKGEIEPGEDALDVARREFEEESGHPAPPGDVVELGEIRQKGGKVVVAWAIEGDLDPALARSNTFEMEWPPHTGRFAEFPEIDRVEWFDLDTARSKIKAAQIPLLERLADAV